MCFFLGLCNFLPDIVVVSSVLLKYIYISPSPVTATFGSVALPWIRVLDPTFLPVRILLGSPLPVSTAECALNLGGDSADCHSLQWLQFLRKHLAIIIYILSWINSMNHWKTFPNSSLMCCVLPVFFLHWIFPQPSAPFLSPSPFPSPTLSPIFFSSFYPPTFLQVSPQHAVPGTELGSVDAKTNRMNSASRLCTSLVSWYLSLPSVGGSSHPPTHTLRSSVFSLCL